MELIGYLVAFMVGGSVGAVVMAMVASGLGNRGRISVLCIGCGEPLYADEPVTVSPPYYHMHCYSENESVNGALSVIEGKK